jgi:glycosyltransferase involved in cell wall biosynthesis
MALWKVLYQRGSYGTKAIETAKGYLRRIADLFRIGRYDVVFIHAWVTPFGSTLFERLTRRLARKLIYDLEDNLLTNHSGTTSQHPNPFLKFLKGRGKPVYLVKSADQVIVSTPFLSDTARELNGKNAAAYIGPSVDAQRFVPPDRSAAEDGDIPTIGWTGTFSSRPYLDLLRGVLTELARRVPYKLKIIGNFEYELPGVDLEVVQWTAEREVEDLQSIDIGIYPLAMEEWDLGKGGLKAIQYMTVEAPPVATDFGTNPMIIRQGETGFLVKTDEEWLRALETLVRNPELRRRLGRAARVDAVAKFSTEAVAGDYRQLLASVIGSDQ